jgi:hypothetical protein
MSLILLGPKRIYIVLFCYQKLADSRCPVRRSFVAIDRAFSTEQLTYGGYGHPSGVRLVKALRCYRLFWEHLIGLSLLVFDQHI